MSFAVHVLHPSERVDILTKRLANLRSGRGDFRPSNRVLAVKETARALEEAKADLARLQ